MAEAINLWSGWPRMVEVALNAVLFFVLIVALVRIVGKRATSQFNNFDWIINIAVGSLAASGILLKNVATLDAVLAILVIAACQYLATFWVRKTELGSRVVKARPTLLTHKSEFLRDAMAKARISEAEIRAALRLEGIHDDAGANWVILETNGELTVIPARDVTLDDASALEDVGMPERVRN
ncbi:MAG: DUF421 domain-containing protein [Sphingomonadaceae bacterium]|nr:MAG: DUF421 domain-containing protein [Sphingomonadaceae bacterium]